MTRDELKQIIDTLLDELDTTPPAGLAYADVAWRIGSAFQALAEHEAAADNLQHALDAYNQALDCCAPTDYPIQVASIFNERGTAFRKMAVHADTIANLNRAITCHQRALKILQKDSAEWARTQTSIGNTYQMMAGTADWDKLANLLRAINAYEKAVHVLPPTSAEHAATQNNLGLAYARLAQFQDKRNNLEHAIAAHRTALAHYSPDAHPLAYAQTQRNLGIAYEDLGQAAAAVACWQEAAQAYARVAADDETDEMLLWIDNVDSRPTPPAADADAQQFRSFISKLFRR